MIAKCSLLPPSPTSENDLRYTVFVGGSEVTDWLVTLKTARVVSRFYEEQGYDDVVIVDTKSDLPVTTKQGEIQ